MSYIYTVKTKEGRKIAKLKRDVEERQFCGNKQETLDCAFTTLEPERNPRGFQVLPLVLVGAILLVTAVFSFA